MHSYYKSLLEQKGKARYLFINIRVGVERWWIEFNKVTVKLSDLENMKYF